MPVPMETGEHQVFIERAELELPMAAEGIWDVVAEESTVCLYAGQLYSIFFLSSFQALTAPPDQFLLLFLMQSFTLVPRPLFILQYLNTPWCMFSSTTAMLLSAWGQHRGCPPGSELLEDPAAASHPRLLIKLSLGWSTRRSTCLESPCRWENTENNFCFNGGIGVRVTR